MQSPSRAENLSGKHNETNWFEGECGDCEIWWETVVEEGIMVVLSLSSLQASAKKNVIAACESPKSDLVTDQPQHHAASLTITSWA